MKYSNPQWDDTIVALATPPGIGAIGVIRLSGPAAISIVDALFPAKDLSVQPSHTVHVGVIKEGDYSIDEVVVTLFKGPRSYTGENVVEVSGHGSPYVLQQLIDAFIRGGARLARPGEFTQRAFLHGKLDLTQAEAVADLIASNTSASHRNALHNIRGGFSAELKALREQLISFSALIELELDFSQEDVEFADRSQLYHLVTGAIERVSKLAHSFQLGNVIKNGVTVAIIGKPNAGKSTLLNTLLNENRAIVSEIAGTTRDTIEEVLNVDGILFRFIDTAGIREHSLDVIENIGVERSLEKMRQADVVLYLFDVNTMPVGELLASKQEFDKNGFRYLLVGNQVDKGDESDMRDRYASATPVLFISAKQGLHIEVLKERLVDMVLQGEINSEDTIVTNARHFHALQQMLNALQDVRQALDAKIPGDLLALDIRRALHYLGEITGEVSNEDLLDYIFSKFCIGK
ncbi:tRNA uridine-5-carboxymethylaminomethyl(34) synthesis GTPase MnmE [Flavihumibacter profundi]|uniref:tRNA uridine-5-carboxymethylaminomethyl(34) synthesis GTPase MnmE n=1 Tax=Flavihumibacter profundi TaxID=2716883 RepID=UPI001CC5BE07|nr:tRNA uridine-5-carboxymethylaminomethyl(34) synthesis GTPase MnmE [Flavihumibacter profundi]MBZ5859454.1 tRNA uridine-5-carboxymethylaminomethyl(34) synthesis GTPase MnmE [Flavihumibacter profundi]